MSKLSHVLLYSQNILKVHMELTKQANKVYVIT